MFNLDPHAYLPIQEGKTSSDDNITPPTVRKKHYQANFSGHELEIALKEQSEAAHRFHMERGAPHDDSLTTKAISSTHDEKGESDPSFQKQKQLLSRAVAERKAAESSAEESRTTLLGTMRTLQEAKAQLALAEKDLKETSAAIQEKFQNVKERSSTTLPLLPRQSETTIELDQEQERALLILKIQLNHQLSKQEKIVERDKKRVTELEKRVADLRTSFSKISHDANVSLQREAAVSNTILQIVTAKDKNLIPYWRKLKSDAQKSIEVSKTVRHHQEPFPMPSSRQGFAPTEKTYLFS